jgi:hypothetical protein
LILHFILENLDLRITIGSSPILDANDSLKFLTNSATNAATIEGFDPRQDLLDYVNNKTCDVRGGNFYKTNYNTPQFDSNITDVQSFYNINYDNTDCTKFGFDGINLSSSNTRATPIFEKFKNANANSAVPLPHTQNIPLPHPSEKWSYKNELVMNGGAREGVSGFTNISDDYAPYQSGGPFAPFENIVKPNACASGADAADLRYNKQNYEP